MLAWLSSDPWCLANLLRFFLDDDVNRFRFVFFAEVKPRAIIQRVVRCDGSEWEKNVQKLAME